MAEKLTAEQARTVKLPPIWHPMKRVAELEAYGEAVGVFRIPDGLLPAIMTRGELVYHAHHNDQLEAVGQRIEANRAAFDADNQGDI